MSEIADAFIKSEAFDNIVKDAENYPESWKKKMIPKTQTTSATPPATTSSNVDSSSDQKGSKSKISVPSAASVGVGINTVLGALSGLTGVASKMGDASRKLVQTSLNPSPTGINEMKGFADTTQQTFDAAKTGIKGISDMNKQFKDNQKLLKERDAYKDYNELEKIRQKYVDKLDQTPDDADWGVIAEEYQKEVTDYFKNSGRDMAALDPNSIQAKQIKRTGRELTNMGQRKKSRVGMENTEKVLDAKQKKLDAQIDSAAEKRKLKGLNMEPKTIVDQMVTKGIDKNGVMLSAKDKDTIDLLVNDVKDIEAAGNWAVGERFDVDTYARLAKKAFNRAQKLPAGSVERQKWEGYAKEFMGQTTEDAIKYDDMLADVERSFIEDPDVSIMDGLLALNKGKSRGYELRNDIDIEELGFVPNKNLIKDFRNVASRKENAIRYRMDQIRQAAVGQNRALTADEDNQLKQMQGQLDYIDHQRDLVTSAYLYSDVAVNIAEAIERTVGDGKKISPHMLFSDESEAQRLLTNSLNPTGDPDTWFELMKTNNLVYRPTDEQLKAAVMLKARKVAKDVTKELRTAWDNHEQLGSDYKGMQTEIMGANGQPVTLEQYMADEMAGILNDYDVSLNIIHKDGSKVPPNGKQIMASIGFVAEDTRDRILDRMDQQIMAMASGGMGGGMPKIPWRFGGKMKAYGSGGAEITLPGGSFKAMTPAQLSAYQTDPNNANKGEEVAKVTLGKWLYDVKNTKAFLDFCQSQGTTPDEMFETIAEPLEAFMTYDTDPTAGGMPSKYMSRLKKFVEDIYQYEQQANGPTITDEIYNAYGLTKPPGGYTGGSVMTPAMMLSLFKKVP